MRQVYPNIFQIKIPLRGNPLKELNCHIVKGERRNLIIDTGFNQPEGRALLLAALEQAGCAPDDTDIFITHLHVDHSGLVGAVKTERNRAYASAYDAAAINGTFHLVPEAGEALKKNPRYEMMGFTEQDGDVGGSHPALRSL